MSESPSPSHPVARSGVFQKLGSPAVPFVVLGIGVLAQVALAARYFEDQTYFVMSVLFVWPATIFTVVVWWLVFSRISWRTRLGGLLVLFLLTFGFFSVVRVDRFHGDMIPEWSLRWNPSPDAKAAEFWKSAALPAADAIPLVAPVPSPQPDDWPDFRGWNRMGVVPGALAATDWDKTPPRELWRHPVGLGWSSFTGVDDFAWTQEQRNTDECTVCYRVSTGEQVWVHADADRFAEVLGGDGPRATPVLAEGKLYAQGATGLLNCLEVATGKPVWTVDILKLAGSESAPVSNIPWGMSASPLVHDGLVYVAPGGTAGKAVLALDSETGEVKWASGKFQASYASLRIVNLSETPTLLVFHGEGLSGLDPETGKNLWTQAWTNDPKVNSAIPFAVDQNSLFISSGYAVGSARLRLVKSSSADWSVEKVWSNKSFRLKFNDAVVRDGFAYGLDEGILACVDLATGTQKWKKGRYGYGQVLLIGEHVLVSCESGEVALVAAKPDRFEELSKFRALAESTTWNHPAVVRGRLLVRNAVEAACFELPLKNDESALQPEFQ